MTSVDYWIPDLKDGVSSQVIATYLEANTDPGGLVVDPFCQSSSIVFEAVRAGRRLVATSVNPLDALRTRVAVVPLSTHDLNSAVTRLSDSPRLDTSLREHLRRLYRTTCGRCHKTAFADYYIWERDPGVPRQVSYRCPACGEAALRDCDEGDLSVLQEVQPRGLHYWYVLDRIARHDDRGRKLVERLLELYTPRNLYVLSDLVRKIEDLFSGSPVQDCLRWALLHCLELGSKLQDVATLTPTAGPLPLQDVVDEAGPAGREAGAAAPGENVATASIGLHPPPRFVEWNVWKLFEDATRRLPERPTIPAVALASSVRALVSSPPKTGGAQTAHTGIAFIGHMSTRDLAQELQPGSVQLILTQPPQMSRTRWAMPFLWTGWLYGHAAAASLWPLLRRRGSDWPWYTRALRATFRAVHHTLAPNGHVVLLAQGKSLAYHEALSMAAAGANLRVQSALFHARDPEVAAKPFAGLRGDYRMTWSVGASTPPWPMSFSELRDKTGEFAVAAAEEALEQRGEPAPFARLHCAIWRSLAQRNVLQRALAAQEPLVLPDWVREQVKTALERQVGQTFVQLWKDDQREECLWWLTQPPQDLVPLSERVEQAVREALAASAPLGTADLLRAVYACFPGVLTPDAEWVSACCKSYGRPVATGRWTLREEDRPEPSAQARQATLLALGELGQRLEYEARLGVQGFDMQWSQAGKTASVFLVLNSAALSRVLSVRASAELAPASRFVVVPEARQGLVHWKLTRFTWLRKQLDVKGWQLINESDLAAWASRLTHDRSQLPLL